jgi:epoxide hydrolase 4
MSVRTVRANGLSFAVDQWGEGEDVALLLHGFPESRVAWARLGPKLAGLGWRVAAPDMRGYGDSDRPAGTAAYRIGHLVSDVQGLFEAIGAAGNGRDPAPERKGRRIVIAHDWGGVVAWAAAMDPATRLDGLVVLNAPHPARYGEVARDGLRQLMRSWYIVFFQLPDLPEMQVRARGGRWLRQLLAKASPQIPEAALDVYAANIMKPGAATAMINYYRANFVAMAREDWRRPIEAPTLLLWGEADPHLDLALARGNDRLVADIEVRTFPGVSHWIEHEAEDEVFDAIAGWARAKGLA